MAPPPLEKVFLLSTGSEATECAMKLAFTYAARAGRAAKTHFVTFENAFHGRTLGAQLAGGSAGSERLDPRQAPGVRPGPLPRRVPDDGYVVRPVRADASRSSGWRPTRSAAS